MKTERPHSSPFPEHNLARQEIKIPPEDKPYFLDALNYTAEALTNNPLIRPDEFTTTYTIPVNRCFVLSLNSDLHKLLQRKVVIPKGEAVAEYQETKTGNQFSLTIKPEIGPDIKISPYTRGAGDYHWLMRDGQGNVLALFGKTDFAIIMSEIAKRSKGECGDKYGECKDAVDPYDLNFQLSMEAQKVATAETSELTYRQQLDSGIKGGASVHTSLKVFDSPEKRCLAFVIAEPSLPVYDAADYASAPPPKDFIGRTTVFTGTIRNSPAPTTHLAVSTHLRGGGGGTNYQELLPNDKRSYYTILRDYTKAMMSRNS